MKYTPHADLLSLLTEKSKEAYLFINGSEISYYNSSAECILTNYFSDQNSNYSVGYNDGLLIISTSNADLNLCIPFNRTSIIPNLERAGKKYCIIDGIEA